MADSISIKQSVLNSVNDIIDVTFGADVSEFCQFFQRFLMIIGYDFKGSTEYIGKFIGIAEFKVLEKVRPRLSCSVREEFESKYIELGRKIESDADNFDQEGFLSSIREISEIILRGMSAKELQLIYSEVLKDLFGEYLDDVLPTLTQQQADGVRGLVDSYNSKV